MDPAKLTASLTELVKKFVISFCQVNVGYNDRLDVFGSIHIRSDDSDVVAFVLNEHCYRKSASDVSEDDDESGPSSKVRKSKSSVEEVSIKTESQNDFHDSFSNHVKQEVSPAEDTNVIDVYSDGEEASENVQGDNDGDADQSFIDHLLEAGNRIDQNLEPDSRDVMKRGRPRRKQFHQQPDMLYYHEQNDFKTELEFNSSFGNADVDYGPATTGEGEEFRYGSNFNEGCPPASQRKTRKRSSAANNSATNSLQGSYFQFESTYTCTACGCRFKSMDGLKCHVNSKHLQQKLYSCQFCSQTFLTRQASYSHRVKFHNISRPKAAPSLGESDFS